MSPLERIFLDRYIPYYAGNSAACYLFFLNIKFWVWEEKSRGVRQIRRHLCLEKGCVSISYVRKTKQQKTRPRVALLSSSYVALLLRLKMMIDIISSGGGTVLFPPLRSFLSHFNHLSTLPPHSRPYFCTVCSICRKYIQVRLSSWYLQVCAAFEAFVTKNPSSTCSMRTVIKGPWAKQQTDRSCFFKCTPLRGKKVTNGDVCLSIVPTMP